MRLFEPNLIFLSLIIALADIVKTAPLLEEVQYNQYMMRLVPNCSVHPCRRLPANNVSRYSNLKILKTGVGHSSLEPQ